MPIIRPEPMALAEVTSFSPLSSATVSVAFLAASLSPAAKAGMVQIISAQSSIISAANLFMFFMAN